MLNLLLFGCHTKSNTFISQLLFNIWTVCFLYVCVDVFVCMCEFVCVCVCLYVYMCGQGIDCTLQYSWRCKHTLPMSLVEYIMIDVF